MLVLGIESTCDETGAAVVENGRKILSNVIASSADLHAKYGGVFPELASRRHLEAIGPVVKKSLIDAAIEPKEIDLIAVAYGPGLVGSLLVGIEFAKGLSIAWQKPIVQVHHIEAHLYAAMMEVELPLQLPALGLVVSGGHTLLVKILDVGSYEIIGSTIDDAAGEAFDKVGSMLNLPYPGGPLLEKMAEKGDSKKVLLTAGVVKNNPYNFSFSGLKTAALYALKKGVKMEDLAASFQETILLDLVKKAKKAALSFEAKAIFFGGGVCNNKRLKELFKENFTLPLYFPSPTLTLDNGAMIAALGFEKYKACGPSALSFGPRARIPIA